MSIVRPIGALALIAVALLGCGPSEEPDDSRTIATDLTDAFVERHRTSGVLDLARSTRGIDAEGWHGPERVGWWTARADAFVGVDVDSVGPGHLEIRMGHFAGVLGSKSLTLSLNGFVLGQVDVPPRMQTFRLDVPDGVLRPGPNEVGLGCEVMHRAGTRELGVYVDWIRIAPAESAWSFAPPDTAATLSAHEWIEGEPGFLPAGTLDLFWVSDGEPIAEESATRLVLVGVDGEGRVLEEWDAAAIADSAGVVQLRAPAATDVAASGRIVLESAVDSVRVRLTHVDRRTAPRDDVLLIVIDTLRADALSCYGAPDGRTSVIDSLATAGWRFDNAVAHAPITGPSHAAMFTSAYPLEAGIVNNHEGALTWKRPTLAELLRWNGYSCRAAISISPIVRRHGFDRGFDEYDQDLEIAYLRRGALTVDAARDFFGDGGDPRPRFGFVHLSEPHEPYDAHGTADERARIRVNGEVVANVSLSDFEPGILELELESGRHALEIETSTLASARRVEIYRSSATGARLEDEVPLQLPAGTWSTSIVVEQSGTVRLIHALNDHGLGVEEIRRRYAEETAATDRFVGDVLRALRASGRADRTWIVFTSDHGEALGEHNHIGHVENLLEPSIHVPLIVCPPAGRSVRRGVVRDDLGAGIDVLPTILDLVGLDVPDGAAGRSLRTRGRDDRFVLVQTNTPQAKTTRYAHRGKDWKVIWNVDRETVRFFDLRSDPGEKRDLASQRPELLARRRTALEEHVFELLSNHQRATASIDPDTEAALRALGYVN